MPENKQRNVSFIHLVLPILILALLIIYGLILQPKVFNKPAFPLEIVFLLATVFSAGHLMFIGFKWKTIQEAIVKKLAKGFPAVLILFAIGLVIGTHSIIDSVIACSVIIDYIFISIFIIIKIEIKFHLFYRTNSYEFFYFIL